MSRFFLPGPAWVDPEVRAAMTRPTEAHRSPPFRALYERLGPRLSAVFRTGRDVVVATGSGTLGLEIALVSTASGPVLHLDGGAFAARWREIAQAHGMEGDRLEVPWGRAVDPDDVRAALRRRRYDAVTVAHCETSTGVLNPVAEIGRVVREESAALLLVDAVSSLAGAPLETDGWAVDVVVTASQKALALPPGLALLSFSVRAEGRARGIRHRGFYTDALRYLERHRAGGPITTPALAQFHALDFQLDRIVAEGVESRWTRHTRLSERTLAWAEGAGLGVFAEPGRSSPTVTCLVPPTGIRARDVVADLAARGWTVGGGYGRVKDQTFRIGHMGDLTLSDLEGLLAETTVVLEALRRGVPGPVVAS